MSIMDDLVLNLAPLGSGPAIKKVKYVGGTWRDRRRAKKRDAGGDKPQTPATGGNAEPTDFSNDHRPSKRQRIDPSGRTGDHNGDRPAFTPRPGDQARGFQVSSKLFSYNPEAKTVFDNEKPAVEVEPARPSNAPLTEEAANFHALGLSRRIAHHLSSKLEMKAPTSIQKNTIPQLVNGDDDAFLQAQTGSGKTLAYLLPIVQRILALTRNDDASNTGTNLHRNSGLFAIILAPTRELCKQISVVLEKLLRCCPWIVSTQVMGGESKHSEKARIRKGCNILIATPGRLTDHLDNTKMLDVGTVRWLVLDEGDRMMEMGFEQDLKQIVATIRKDPLKTTNKDGVELGKALPKRRVTVLCSATMKMNVQKLGEISLHDAIHITASKDDDTQDANEAVFAAPAQLKQTYVVVPAKLRLVTLIAFLKDAFARKGSVMKAIIFISCADSVDFHYDLLKSTEPLKSPPEVSLSDSDKERKPAALPPTVHPATYITSPANPTILLHKLHGSLNQQTRTSTLHSFATCKEPAVLITTDISSRGLDVPSVELVVEYDPAFAIADHVHRIGRTARAGRPGKAALFLLPGCEEAYISMLPSTPPAAAQSYETILQRGFATPVEVPKDSSKGGGDEDEEQQPKQSPHARAEALQLSIEQRLLASDTTNSGPHTKGPAGKGGKKGAQSTPASAKPKMPTGATGSSLLDAGRQGFRSHIRAYATHVKEEREVFDMSQLHLGHTAKSFGLREAPGGIGGGVQKRTHKSIAMAKGLGGGVGTKRKLGGDLDDDLVAGGNVDEEAARRRMQEMIRKMGKDTAGEFNIA
ncbi:ATP-dependent RNA helicase dbp7 [Gnomoniopsis sp. IMI 355080]|nr:ATP-dependent RNA helicase dbp7 [Gnomoniopsis sp. IMI 355080]